MKPIALLIATSLLSTATQAADYGLGVTLGTSTEIFVPLNLRRELRIKPTLAVEYLPFNQPNWPSVPKFRCSTAG